MRFPAHSTWRLAAKRGVTCMESKLVSPIHIVTVESRCSMVRALEGTRRLARRSFLDSSQLMKAITTEPTSQATSISKRTFSRTSFSAQRLEPSTTVILETQRPSRVAGASSWLKELRCEAQFKPALELLHSGRSFSHRHRLCF